MDVPPTVDQDVLIAIGASIIAASVLAWLVFGPLTAATGGAYDRLYLATALSLSSTLIVVKLLYDKLEMATLAGRITLGILIFQDLWAIAFLALQPSLHALRPVPLLAS